MPRSLGIQHTVRNADRTTIGVWGPFELRSAFQPLFRFVEGGRLVLTAHEGLARPFRDGVPLSPAEFFRLVPPEQRLPVDSLLRTIHLLNAATFLPPDTDVFLNFDPSVIEDGDVAEGIMRDLRLVLHEGEIAPARVICEVTEQRIDSAAGFAHFVAALREGGFRIAVDDYGAEDSDAARVRALRPDIIKFDAKWVGHLMASGPGLELLRSMVGEFADQSIVTVFEGIEHGHQLDMAAQAGAAIVQGFALARPQIVSAHFEVFAARRAEEPEALLPPSPSAFPANPDRRTAPLPVATRRPFGRRAPTG